MAAFAATAEAALREGLGVNAGHDLNRDNSPPFLRAVPGVQEVSIGHALGLPTRWSSAMLKTPSRPICVIADATRPEAV